MEHRYDICVNNDTLINLEQKIDLIILDIERSSEQMVNAIQKSENFLEGNQFEKAKQTTETCLKASRSSIGNLRFAKEYLRELQDIVIEYCRCGYRGA